VAPDCYFKEGTNFGSLTGTESARVRIKDANVMDAQFGLISQHRRFYSAGVMGANFGLLLKLAPLMRYGVQSVQRWRPFYSSAIGTLAPQEPFLAPAQYWCSYCTGISNAPALQEPILASTQRWRPLKLQRNGYASAAGAILAPPNFLWALRA
jgi:hypothetical protein